MKNFSIQKNKGLTLVLPNKYRFSLQFGFGNYCENHFKSDTYGLPAESDDAETMISQPDGEPLSYDGGIFQLNQSVEQVIRTLNFANSIGCSSYGIEQKLELAKQALLKIRQIDLADCEKYVQKADMIACEALAQLEKK